MLKHLRAQWSPGSVPRVIGTWISNIILKREIFQGASNYNMRSISWKFVNDIMLAIWLWLHPTPAWLTIIYFRNRQSEQIEEYQNGLRVYGAKYLNWSHWWYFALFVRHMVIEVTDNNDITDPLIIGWTMKYQALYTRRTLKWHISSLP